MCTDARSSAARLAAALFLALAFALTLPVAGQAAVYCVGVTGDCPLFGVDQPDLQTALTAATTNGVPDTVYVGAEGSPYVGPFSYNDPAEKVSIIAYGPTQPVIQAPSPNTSTLSVFATADSLVKGFEIKVPDTSNGAALYWDGIASELKITHSGSAAVHGMRPKDAAVLEDSTIDIQSTSGIAVNGQFAVAATVRDSTITGHALNGVSLSSPGTSVALTRTTITSNRSVVQVASASATVTATQSVFRMIAPIAADGAVYAIAGSFSGNHLTIVGNGTARGVISVATSNPTSVSLTNSVINGFTTSLLRAGGASNADLMMLYSSFDGSTVNSSGSGTFTNGTGNLTTDTAQFVDAAAADLRAVAGQAIIDAGNPLDLSGSDRLDLLRVVDGDGNGVARGDMGAYEYQRNAPVAQIAADTSPAEGQPVHFEASASTDVDDWEALTYQWDFGDGTTATGVTADHTYTAFGPRTVTLTVTDEAGVSGQATLDVTVRDVIAPAGFKYSGFIVKRGRMRGSVGCPASEASCVFTYKLRTNRKIRFRGKRRIVTLASGTVSAAGGQTRTVSRKLSKSIVSLLKRRFPPTTLTLTATDAAGNSASATRRVAFAR